MPHNAFAVVLFHQDQTTSMAGTAVAPAIVTEMLLLHNKAPQVYALDGREAYEDFCRTNLLPAYPFPDALETIPETN